MTSTSRRLAFRALLALVLAALLYAALRTLDWARLGAALVAVRPAWLLAAYGCYVAILPLWAMQWSIIAPVTPRNTFRRMLRVVTLTSSALNTTPLLLGEVAGAMLLVSTIGIGATEAVSVSMMDQLLVGIAKLVVITSAALTNPLPAWMARGLVGMSVGVAAAGTVFMLAAFHSDVTSWVLLRRLPPRFTVLLSKFAAALAPLRAPGRAGPALALALAKKAVEIAAILCVQRAFGVHLPLSSALLVLASLNLATLVPVVPGNVGVYEGVVTVAYVALGVSAEQAAAIAVTQHACFFASLALPGYVRAAFAGASRRAAAAR